MIIVDSLSKTYGSTTVLDGLSFTVPDGAVTGFLGPNGSGKTTTIRCMLGLDAPTSGSVRFSSVTACGVGEVPGTPGRSTGSASDAQPGSEEAARPLASHPNRANVVGAMVDAGWFSPRRSGINHLRVLALSAGVPTSRADECLDLVGLRPAARKPVATYSLGMKQRLGLAAAMLGDPQHLILDEPGNGLDPEGLRWIRSAIRTFADQGRGVLVSSHILAEMEQIADRLVVIGDGRLLGEGSLESFTSRGAHLIVESPQAVLLAEDLALAGYHVSPRPPHELVVTVDDASNERTLRLAVSRAARERGYDILRLQLQRESLEEAFLEATGASAAYVAGGAGSQPGFATTAAGVPEQSTPA